MRTIRVHYTDPKGQSDETEFDINDTDFDAMFNELNDLFLTFCEETYKEDYPLCEIVQVWEVPYDGEE